MSRSMEVESELAIRGLAELGASNFDQSKEDRERRTTGKTYQ